MSAATTVHGAVDLASATVDGCLDLRYRVTADHQLSLAGCHADAVKLEPYPSDQVTIDLRDATVASIEDSARHWPKMLKLDGLSYNTLRPLLTARDRLRWLQRNNDARAPQPYQELARQYRNAGYDHEARRVLFAEYRTRTRLLPFPRNVWGLIQDMAVGYG